MAPTLPSMPRSPKPPGTSTPSTPANSASAPFALDRLAVDPLHADAGAMGHPGMVQRLVNRLVGVAMLGVLADHRDGDLVFRIAEPLQQVAPAIEVQLARRQPQLADDQLVQAVLDQAHGHFVDGEVLVLLLDDGLYGHVAEQRDLRPVVARSERSVRQTRMSGWMPICRSRPTECWVGLVFSSAAAFK